MSNSYHTELGKRQKAAEEARVKSILIFAESLKKRLPNQFVRAAHERIVDRLMYRDRINYNLGRKKGGVAR